MSKLKLKKPRGYWRPLVKVPKESMAAVFGPEPERVVEIVMHDCNLDREAALELLRRDTEKCEYWLNDLYQVEVRQHGNIQGSGLPLVQLNVRRRDGGIIRDWRDLQRIKNEIVGPECEAVELFPAESRLVDTTNKYHLWAVADPTFRFGFGFEERDVQDDEGETRPGLKQRRLTE